MFLINVYQIKNDICLFLKGTPEAPQCGFSMAVSNILKLLNVNFKGINVLENESMRQAIKEYSDWPTIPQLYISISKNKERSYKFPAFFAPFHLYNILRPARKLVKIK